LNQLKIETYVNNGFKLEIIPVNEYIGPDDSENTLDKEVFNMDMDAYTMHLSSPGEKNKALMNTGYRAKKSNWKKYMKPFESKNY
jgi:hypothetical protein